MLPDGKRILIVDDHDDSREALIMVLQSSGYAVHAVRDGARALVAVRTWQPEVVCIDLMLPSLSGYDVGVGIVAAFGQKRPLLVAITALTTDAHRERAAEVGFDGYVLKPYEIDLLLDIIAKGRHRPAGEPLARQARSRP